MQFKFFLVEGSSLCCKVEFNFFLSAILPIANPIKTFSLSESSSRKSEIFSLSIAEKIICRGVVHLGNNSVGGERDPENDDE